MSMDYKDQLIEFQMNSGVDTLLENIEVMSKMLDISEVDRLKIMASICRVMYNFCESEVNNNIATETDTLMDQEKDRKAGI